MKLRAYYGFLRGERHKGKQLLFDGPNGPDRRLVADILSEKVCKELEARGYDLSTMKFEITRKPDV